MKKTDKSILGLLLLSFVIFSCNMDLHEHTFSDEWSSNETEHWHAATCEHSSEVSDKADHTFGEWKTTKESTEENEGSKERSCSVCSYKETGVIEKKAHVHTIATDWSFDSEKHWHAASCNNEEHNEDAAAHTWNHTDYEYDTKSGKNIRVCTECSYVDIKGHVHTEDDGKVTTEPDCVTKGVKTYKCTVCDAVVRTEDVDAKGHTEDSGKVTTEPGCVTKGVKTYKCSVCDAVVRTEDVPAAGHNQKWEITKSATTVSAGVMEYKCKNCNEIFRKELYCDPSEVCVENVEHEDQYKDTITESFNYIYFGVFPKTSKSSSVTVDEEEIITMGGNKYFHGSDDEWYAKVDTKYFKVEPIKWKLLTTDYAETGKALLLSEYVLTGNVPFYFNPGAEQREIDDKTIYDNNYKYSTIRAYLNGKYEEYDTQPTDYEYKGFLQTAFGTSAQTLIIETEVDNGYETTGYTGWDNEFDYSCYYTSKYACDNTVDKIFLLSQSEVCNNYGFADENDCYTRIRNVTDYAKANNTSSGYWWLRSPNSSDIRARNISNIGGFGTLINVYQKDLGVVPALWITLQ